MNELFDDECAVMLRQAIGRTKTKYSLISSLISIPRIDNIHINLDSILSFITNKYLDKSDDLKNSNGRYTYVIASSILNIAGHYRHYCIKNGWNPKVYMYVTHKWDIILEEAISIVEIITNYLKGIYLIKVTEDCIPCVYMKYFIDSNDGYNLVITKQYLDLQLISNKTNILHANKDHTIIYTPKALYGYLTESDDMCSNISPDLVGPFMFVSGLGTANKGIKHLGKKKTIKLFDNLIKDGYLFNGKYTSYDDLERDLLKGIKDEDFTPLYENFTLYDLGTLYNKCMTKSKKKILDSYIIDKFSRNDLMMLNEKYFTGLDSLLLDFLIEVPAENARRQIKWW